MLWDDLKEVNINQKEIEELFEVKVKIIFKKASAQPLTQGPIIPLNTKKRFFNDKRTQSIGITIAKMPILEKILESLTRMDETLLTRNQIAALNRGKVSIKKNLSLRKN